jgi:formate hydrogenlyase transcriptional activator
MAIPSVPIGRPVITPQGERLSQTFEATKESDAELQKFVVMIPAIVWRAAPDGTRDFHNQAWHDYTGLSPAQARGWGWQSAVHPDDLSRMLKEWEVIRTSEKAGKLEARVRRFDGQFRWFELHCVPFRRDLGEIVCWYGCSIDVEERKGFDYGLRRDEAELRNVTDAIWDLIAIVAPDEKLLYINRCFADYTGRDMSDVIAGNFRELVFHPDDIQGMQNDRQAGLRAGVPFALEARLRRRDGEYRWQRIRYSPVRDQEARIYRWYTTGLDIHDEKVIAVRLQNENVALREEITRSSMFEEIVGSSEPMQRVLTNVARVATSDSTVLILGETGTGKELIARAVHAHSPRSAKAFIRVNCAAIPQSLIASELFGHEKGAFTGALQRRLGRFEAADGGTLFLDEIGDLPGETQIALLRVLQEREFERVGSNHAISVDVRVVAATNRNLIAGVQAGTFRQDLFYRLNVFPIQIPSLRERASDIPLLVEYFIERYARKVGKRIGHVSNETLDLFKNYDWPGNIRELQNVIERGVILCDGDTFAIDENWLVKTPQARVRSEQALDAAVARRERELIQDALVESGGRISGPLGAAAKLKLPRQTLASKMKTLGIQRG